MSKNYDRAEHHIANSLRQHPENMHGVMHELHNLQHHESAGAFKKDVARMNEDLHKQGLLPNLQISVNDASHKVELKNADGSPGQGPNERTAHEPSPQREQVPQEDSAPGRPAHKHGHHGGSGDGGHHGRHKGRHGRHGSGGEGQGQDGDEQQEQPEQAEQPGQPAADRRDQPADGTRQGPRDSAADGTDSGAGRNTKDSQNLTKEDKEKYLMQRLTSPDGLALTRAQAAGVIGNLEHESHLNQNYSQHKNADGRTEHNLGIAQWVGKRKHDLERFAGKDSENFYKQVDFMEHELKGSERGALAHVKQSRDASSAALAFSKWYERPGAPHNSSRVYYAQLAYAKYANGGYDT
jgi:hypothetical protein